MKSLVSSIKELENILKHPKHIGDAFLTESALNLLKADILSPIKGCTPSSTYDATVPILQLGHPGFFGKNVIVNPNFKCIIERLESCISIHVKPGSSFVIQFDIYDGSTIMLPSTLFANGHDINVSYAIITFLSQYFWSCSLEDVNTYLKAWLKNRYLSKRNSAFIQMFENIRKDAYGCVVGQMMFAKCFRERELVTRKCVNGDMFDMELERLLMFIVNSYSEENEQKNTEPKIITFVPLETAAAAAPNPHDRFSKECMAAFKPAVPLVEKEDSLPLLPKRTKVKKVKVALTPPLTLGFKTHPQDDSSDDEYCW
jgi:hypothetical protein